MLNINISLHLSCTTGGITTGSDLYCWDLTTPATVALISEGGWTAVTVGSDATDCRGVQDNKVIEFDATQATPGTTESTVTGIPSSAKVGLTPCSCGLPASNCMLQGTDPFHFILSQHTDH